MTAGLPAEFENRMKKLLGREWEEFLQCYDNDRYFGLRLNPEKVPEDRETEVLAKLSAGRMDLFTPVPWAKHAWYYSEGLRPGKHMFHESGLYYIQEPSAMSAAALLAPEKGMRVLDLCAAPGGKTTQLASYLNGTGLLVANEINNSRCRILSQNVERMGLKNCIVTNEDSSSLADHFPVFFHEILVDAPCSGEGMFRKNPEAASEWSPENVAMCAERQAEILDNAARMLLPGGKMVYSTCTFAPEENEISIYHFLQRHPEFSVEACAAPYFSPAHPEWIPEEGEARQPETEMAEAVPLTEAAQADPGTCGAAETLREQVGKTFRLWPHKLKGEGHYAAVLRKVGKLPEIAADPEMLLASGTGCSGRQDDGSLSESRKPSAEAELTVKAKGKKKRDNFGKDEYDRKNSRKGGNAKGGRSANKEIPDPEQLQLLNEFLSETVTRETAAWILSGKLILFGEQIYRLPAQAPSLSGIHVLRAGLQLGEYKKNRFEPSHALAMALSPKNVKKSVLLSAEDERSKAWFRGETFAVTDEDFTDHTMAKGGWCLMAPEGFSAGWCKCANGMLKNHYPKGLRVSL